MNNINCTNNVSFNAKLNISGLKRDKARWNNIAKIFEEKTAKQYPEDTLFLESLGNEKGIRIDDQAIIDDRDGCIMDEKLYNRLMKLPDDKIAGKFKKLLVCLEEPAESAMKLAEKVCDLADENSLKESFYKLYKNPPFYNGPWMERGGNWIAGNELLSIINDAVETTLRKKTNETIANDSILKHLDMVIY